MWLSENVDGLSCKVEQMAAFSKLPAFWNIIVELMAGNVFISGVDALMYVVLSKAEIHWPYGALFGTAVCVTWEPVCPTDRV